MSISKEKEDKLLRKMEELGIKEEDIIEKFILGTGSGGQKINKTSSCVYLKHIPSGIEVKCQKERSRALNRFWARRELCEKFAAEILAIKTKKQQVIEKIRRQKRRRSRKTKEKMLKAKKAHSEKKHLRSSPTE